MMADTISLLLHHHVEFDEDASLLIELRRPLKPPPPTRHTADYIDRLYPYGRSLGPPRTHTHHTPGN